MQQIIRTRRVDALAVRINLYLCLIALVGCWLSSAEAATSWLVWYVVLSNSFLNAVVLKNRDVFSPQHIFPAAYALFLMTQFIFQSPFLLAPEATAQFLICGGIIMYLIGASPREAVPDVEPHRGAVVIKKREFVTMVAGLLAMTFVGIVAYRAQAQFPVFVADVENYRFSIQSHLAFFGPIWYLCLTAPIGFALSALGVILVKDSGVRTLLLLAGVLFFFSLWLWGIRGRVVDAVVLVVIYYHYFARRVEAKKLLIGGAFLLLVLAVAGARRLQTAGDKLQGGILLRMAHEVQVSSSNLELLVETFPSRLKYTHGLTLLYPFYTLLPGHQEGTAERLKDVLGVEFDGGGLTPTIVGDFYIDFGMPGVFLGMLAVGTIFRYVYRKRTANKYGLLAYPLVIDFSIEFVRNGGIINFLLFYYLTIIFCVSMVAIRFVRAAPGIPAGLGPFRRPAC